MRKIAKENLVKQVIVGARENSIGVVLFHQVVGRILGVNVTDMKCLDIIALKGSANPSQLAKLTGLSTGSTTAMMDRLEKKGLIERRPNPEDRRGAIVVLTNGAAKKFRPSLNRWQRPWKHWFRATPKRNSIPYRIFLERLPFSGRKSVSSSSGGSAEKGGDSAAGRGRIK